MKPYFWPFYSYLSYWLHATTEHSLHSPLAYSWYTQVIRPGRKQRTQEPSVFKQIEVLRRRLLDDQTLISPLELGAGSRVGGGPGKRVADIARVGLSEARFSALYYRIIGHIKACHVLELGTSLGINTCYLASTPHATVHTLEGCPQLAERAKAQFQALGIENVHLVLGNIDDTLPSLLKQVPAIDFAFFDANHRLAPTLDYFTRCLEKSHEDSVFVFDDIHWSKEMNQAWKEIKAHPKVSLSMDLYRAGIVLFKKGLDKQHYTLEL